MECDSLAVSVQGYSALLSVNVIGAVEAWTESSDGTNILPRMKKAKAVVVLLAFTEGFSLTRSELIRLLWSGYEPSEALTSLRQTLFKLRRNPFMDALLISTRERIGLRVREVWIDARDDPDRAFDDITVLRNAAIDLDDLDPVFFKWLQTRRDCLRHRRVEAPTPKGVSLASPQSGVVERLLGRGTLLIREIRRSDLQVEYDLFASFLQEVKIAATKLRWLSVFSSHNTTSEPADRVAPWQKEDTDFVVDITARKSRDAIRTTTSLIEGRTGVLLGAWHTHSPASEWDDSQEQVAARIAAKLEQEILLCEGRRFSSGGETYTAYGKAMKAISLFQTFHYDDFVAAGDLFRDAVQLEPVSAYYHCWLAMWNMFFVGQGWSRKPDANVAEAIRSADRAVMLDPSSARAISIAAHIQAFLRKRPDEANSLHERAILLQPGLPLVWELSAATSVYSGQLKEAKLRLERARDLLPQHSQYSFHSDAVEMLIQLFDDNTAEVVKIGRRITQLHPRFTAPYKPYLSALGHLGVVEEAKLLNKRLLSLDPSFSITVARRQSPFASSEMLKYYLSGLRKAGLREVSERR